MGKRPSSEWRRFGTFLCVETIPTPQALHNYHLREKNTHLHTQETMLGWLRLDKANHFESGVVMRTKANAVKYDRLARGDCMSTTTCFGCFRGNWNKLETT